MASEAMLTSYIAVAKGDVPVKHWRRLSRGQLQKDGYCGRSLFINNELDYSRGQTKFTLLEKTKTNLRTSEQILLYRRSTYQK